MMVCLVLYEETPPLWAKSYYGLKVEDGITSGFRTKIQGGLERTIKHYALEKRGILDNFDGDYFFTEALPKELFM